MFEDLKSAHNILQQEYDALKNLKEALDTEQLDLKKTKEASQARVTALEQDITKLEEEIENLKKALDTEQFDHNKTKSASQDHVTALGVIHKALEDHAYPVQLILTLGLDFSIAGSEGSDKGDKFKRDVAEDLASASGLPSANFRIKDVSRTGSIILDVQVLPDPLAPGKHLLAAKDLADQAADASSKLRSGKITIHVIGVEVRPYISGEVPAANIFFLNLKSSKVAKIELSAQILLTHEHWFCKLKMEHSRDDNG